MTKVANIQKLRHLKNQFIINSVPRFVAQNPVQIRFKLEGSLHLTFAKHLPTVPSPALTFSNSFHKLRTMRQQTVLVLRIYIAFPPIYDYHGDSYIPILIHPFNKDDPDLYNNCNCVYVFCKHPLWYGDRYFISFMVSDMGCFSLLKVLILKAFQHLNKRYALILFKIFQQKAFSKVRPITVLKMEFLFSVV